jgi:hypothetical protein
MSCLFIHDTDGPQHWTVPVASFPTGGFLKINFIQNLLHLQYNNRLWLSGGTEAVLEEKALKNCQTLHE